MYDLTYILNPNLSEEEVVNYKKQIRDLIISKEGQILAELPENKRKLAYPLKKMVQGYYLSLDFEMPAESLAELEKKLKLDNNVLRHLIIKKEKIVVEAFSEEDTTKSRRERRPKKEERVKIEELDKKLEELLQ